ncbi:MAG TPA: hypothetical protein VFP80_18850 [Thermoanaerobaculia bacterium]|nr:hypothetical protein [Thermoanaerobaculia bacterium]
MAKTVETDQEAVEQVLAELRALPANSLSGEELMSYIRRLPKPDLPEGWTSADDIRELRGPLPEDDPVFQRNILGRR